MLFLLIAETVLLVIVLLGYPIVSKFRTPADSAPLRGLNLPKGSVRSMLALMSVGSLVVVATFGVGALDADQYERVVTMLATLAGPILGFYFGSRGAESRHGHHQPGPASEPQ